MTSLESKPKVADRAIVTPNVDISVCILATDDVEALQLTATSASMLGSVVIGQQEGATPVVIENAILVTIPLIETIGQAWDRLLRAAPHERCVLLQPGEVVLAGQPGQDTPFAPSIVVDHPDAYEPPDRLGPVRVVDRGACRIVGRLRPVVDHDGPDHDETGSLVIVDTGMRRGAAYEAWVQFLAVGLDDTEDPAELLDMATLLALTGEHDAAITRLYAMLGAFEGDLGRRIARLLAYCAVRRGRRMEAVHATHVWERLEPNPGPALALRGVALATQQLSGHALPLLEAALASGLTDSDGVTVDRTWIEAMVSKARQRLPRVESLAGQEVYSMHHRSALGPLLEAWNELGRPVSELLGLFNDVSRRIVRNRIFETLGAIDSISCIQYAEELAADGMGPNVVDLLVSVVARGDITLDEVRPWADRVRAAGREKRCPLVEFAGVPVGPPVERVLAAAELIDRYQDERGRELLETATRSLPTAAIGGALHRLAAEVPSVLGAFIEAAARSSARREALAVTLERGGAPELAEQLRSA